MIEGTPMEQLEASIAGQPLEAVKTKETSTVDMRVVDQITRDWQEVLGESYGAYESPSDQQLHLRRVSLVLT